MAMTDPELYEIARRTARRIFVEAAATAHSNLDELKGAVEEIDVAMNATTTQANTQYPGEMIMVVMRDRARSQAPNLTNTEAYICLAYWAMKEAGLM